MRSYGLADVLISNCSGEFLASHGRYKEAAGLYEKAAILRPRDYELAVAAATAMRQADRLQDAEYWYRKAVHLRPTVSLISQITVFAGKAFFFHQVVTLWIFKFE